MAISNTSFEAVSNYTAVSIILYASFDVEKQEMVQSDETIWISQWSVPQGQLWDYVESLK